VSTAATAAADVRIWVDADACPRAIKEILYRAAERTKTRVTLVASHPLWTPPSEWVDFERSRAGLDGADRHILARVGEGDLVITADIPLAAQVVARGGIGLDPRGELYTKDNVGERLAMRNLMDELRGAGEITGGPAALGQADHRAFANLLDRFLTERRK
jgi:uncharacterized protein YaiI (UPF0178 family)